MHIRQQRFPVGYVSVCSLCKTLIQRVGTHCAALAGGKTFGVATASRIVAVKVLNQNGFGHVESIIRGIAWAVDHAHGVPGVISLSLGTFLNDALDDAATAAGESMAVVVAAGNEGDNACKYSPAHVGGASGKNGVVVVGATNILDKRSNFSNYGGCVDIWAPGTQIVSAYIGSTDATTTLDGTSMACPVVAGVVASLLEKNGFDKAAAIAELFSSSAKNKIKGSKVTRNRLVQTVKSTRSPTVSIERKVPTAFPTHGPAVLCVKSICAEVEFSIFGPFIPVEDKLEGKLVLAKTYLCKAVAESHAGEVVLVKTGGCSHFEKVYYAQNTGASAVVLIDTQKTIPLLSRTGKYEQRRANIPSMLVDYDSGKRLGRLVGETASIGVLNVVTTPMGGELGCQGLEAPECKLRPHCQWKKKRLGALKKCYKVN